MSKLICSTVVTSCGLIFLGQFFEIDGLPSGMSFIASRLGNFISWTNSHGDERIK